MKSKTLIFIVMLISLFTLISSASAACSSCKATPTGEDCPTCGDDTADDSECTDLAITDFTVNADCSETPCTISFSGSVDGDATKIKYTLINENGRKVCSKLATCEEGNCEAECTVFKPGTYTAVMKACGPDGCCVTQSKEVVVDSSSCGSCNSDNGRHHRWNNFRGFHHLRGFGHR